MSSSSGGTSEDPGIVAARIQAEALKLQTIMLWRGVKLTAGLAFVGTTLAAILGFAGTSDDVAPSDDPPQIGVSSQISADDTLTAIAGYRTLQQDGQITAAQADQLVDDAIQDQIDDTTVTLNDS